MDNKTLLKKVLKWLEKPENSAVNSKEIIIKMTFSDLLSLTLIPDLKAASKFNISKGLYEFPELLTLSLQKTTENEFTFYHCTAKKLKNKGLMKFSAYHALSTHKQMIKIIKKQINLLSPLNNLKKI